MIQKIVSIVSLLAILSVCMAEVPTFLVTQASASLNPNFDRSVVPMDVHGDILVMSVFLENSKAVSVRRRRSDGWYDEITSINETDVAFTNGEWIAYIDDSGMEGIWKLSQLNGDLLTNEVSFPGDFLSAAGFFPGNVLVGTQNRKAPSTFEIYRYTDSWKYSSAVNIGNHYVMTYGVHMSTDRKFVLTANYTFIDIWKYDEDLVTFEKIESIAFDSNYINLGIYNGVDTVVAANAGLGEDIFGAFQIYTKTNGQWAMTQSGSALELGLRGVSNLGYSGIFIDENQFVLTAYSENSFVGSPSSPSGKCIAMSRGVDGNWTQTLQLEADPADNISLGYNVVLNDYNELLIPSLDQTAPKFPGYIYSTCVTASINVTCHDITEAIDCDNFDMNINMTSLYTIYNLPACGEVNVTEGTSVMVNNQKMIEFNFFKISTRTSCTSTVACIAPPSTDAPVVAPVGGASTPVKTPAGRASSASFIELAGAVLIAVALAL